MNVAQGFQFAGLHAGIKPQRKDLALVFSPTPCAGAPLDAYGPFGGFKNSGIGNAYSDEMLHAAKAGAVHPAHAVHREGIAEVRRFLQLLEGELGILHARVFGVEEAEPFFAQGLGLLELSHLFRGERPHGIVSLGHRRVRGL